MNIHVVVANMEKQARTKIDTTVWAAKETKMQAKLTNVQSHRYILQSKTRNFDGA